MYRTYKDMGNSSDISKTSNKKFLKPYNSIYENIYENAEKQLIDTVDINIEACKGFQEGSLCSINNKGLIIVWGELLLK